VVGVSDFGIKVEYYGRFNLLNKSWTHSWIYNQIRKEADINTTKTAKTFVENVLVPTMKQKMKQIMQED
jgi:hypothetical protein